MTYAYINCGIDFNDILAISSMKTTATTIKAVLDDEVVYFSKLEGYTAFSDDNGTVHLAFDESKYNQFLETEKKKQQEQAEKQEAEAKKDLLLGLITITEEPSDKEGYNFKIYKIGDVVVKKEYIQNGDDLNDGSDYTKPITYKEGMSVIKSAWYTDGTDIWECIKTGTPSSFSDTEYFDIITS